MNEYDIPDDDQDILGESQYDHNVDGQVCPSCGIVHRIKGVNSSDLPPEVLTQIQKELQGVPPHIARNMEIWVGSDGPSDQSDVLESLEKRFGSQKNSLMPLLRSLAEVLDRFSGGEVTERMALRQHEHNILHAHLWTRILDSFSKMLDAVSENQLSNKPKMAEELNGHIAKARKALAGHIEEYRAFAQEMQMSTDESLIEKGIVSTPAYNIYNTETELLKSLEEFLADEGKEEATHEPKAAQ